MGSNPKPVVWYLKEIFQNNVMYALKTKAIQNKKKKKLK